MTKPQGKVTIVKNGPYLVSGNLPLDTQAIRVGADNEPETFEARQTWKTEETYALCRCGKSKNKPFCDGSHVGEEFDGTEVAEKTPFAQQARILQGPEVDLADAESFCMGARFCHSGGGTWKLVRESEDMLAKGKAIREACMCPSGRLVAIDKETKKPIEPEFEPSISLIEDPQGNASGPVWVKGGVPIESQVAGEYETRNRVTLCRC